jgi:hypothetical protein
MFGISSSQGKTCFPGGSEVDFVKSDVFNFGKIWALIVGLSWILG